MLLIKNIERKEKGRQVVYPLSLTLNKKEIVALLGPNGAGKSTSFRMIAGIIKPDHGSIYLNDVNITSMSLSERARMGMLYLPQDSSIFKELSVYDNLKIAEEVHKEYGEKEPGGKMRDRLKKEKSDLSSEKRDLSNSELASKHQYSIESLVKIFHLEHVINVKASFISGGERRRLEIARLLLCSPQYILLDEPFAGIDPISISEIKAIVRKIAASGIGVLITDHNVLETLSLIDSAKIIYQGRIITSGTPEDIANDEQVKKLYLGEALN